MKKIFKLFVVTILCLGVISGCSKNEEKKEAKELTPAQKIVSSFKKNVKEENDIETLAAIVNQDVQEITGYQTDAITLKKDDYIEGFDKEIKGFDKAVVIKTMIGGQPFIAYIFDVKSATEFEKELNDHADLRWNICTSADEAKSYVYENYVFFVMSKINFDE